MTLAQAGDPEGLVEERAVHALGGCPMDIEPEVLRSAAGVAVAVAVRGESELDVEVPLPVLRVPALEREERGKPLARQPLHALGLGGRHVEDRVCLDHGDVAARRFQPLR